MQISITLRCYLQKNLKINDNIKSNQGTIRPNVEGNFSKKRKKLHLDMNKMLAIRSLNHPIKLFHTSKTQVLRGKKKQRNRPKTLALPNQTSSSEKTHQDRRDHRTSRHLFKEK